LIDLKCGMNTGEVLFGLLDTQTRFVFSMSV
jgi:hypothetical protein